MGLGITTVGHATSGACSCDGHGGSVIYGSVISGMENVRSNGLPTGRVTSIVKANCGHESPIFSGSNTVWNNGLHTSRVTSVVGEEGVDCYIGIVIDGSNNVKIG